MNAAVHRKIQKLFLLTFSVGIFFFTTGSYISYAEEAGEADETFAFTIMHTNDTHAHLEDVAKRVTAVNEVRSTTEHSILLDAGDVFSGTLFFNKYKGQADLEFMNMLGYDAMVPGNHEFDDGPGTFAAFVQKADFPFVSANINYRNEPELSGLYVDDFGDPGENGKIYPAVILDVNGEKIGIFGLTTEDTAFISNPGDHLIFEDYLEKAEDTVAGLKELNINKIIAVTHLGYNYDRILADTVKGIDVIVGGHSHTLLNEPQVFHADDEPTLVVQTGEYGENLGKLDVVFDESGVLQEWNGALLKVADYEADPAAAARLDELMEPIEEMKQQIVGYTDVFLDGSRENIRSKETNLGNLIADGMLARAKQIYPDTVMAFQNSGGIRASINVGAISLGDVLTVMPFGNNLVTLDLTGEEVLAALENSVSQVEDGHGKFLQVAGLHFAYDRSKSPGQRVTDVQVKTDSGFEPLDPEKMYKAATNAFAADGGDGFESFRQAKNDGRIQEIYIVDYEVFNWYLNEIGNVNIDVDGRITEGDKATLPEEEEEETPPGGTPPPDEEDDDGTDPPGGEDDTPTPPPGGKKGNGDDEPRSPANNNVDSGNKTTPVFNEMNGENGPPLPDTATNMYNLSLLGFFLLGTGCLLLIVLRWKAA
ncbi:2',3'-cyclic-nucleotide 2'-phosphodiesterase / 3'-nucleotidase / 5'-nucleotidase [Evansella caseinilytica]|uniref:2',3'-cyclic-nucleotide 2'-phosphodiesterase / 3'-nucleotidase / 5'-nucleotidase n=1 Tax=Evansella caseinilytica TaxID=1503961 RepID=A0A1H3QCE4_9BACI|nr:5'-nucleotidase C-terminal domain-containing protein [Evansella caseinilytica]SDZ10801.1 2',3'-cyclic-nucleotide 2'-phosphodiesterase / 3'-nucleotidase / 5'-nucleotidase [Evansella caseinilytica]